MGVSLDIPNKKEKQTQIGYTKAFIGASLVPIYEYDAANLNIYQSHHQFNSHCTHGYAIACCIIGDDC
jgi:peptide methionine sulfoxide reductase MsrB